MVKVTVKWNKSVFESVELKPDEGVAGFKETVFRLTNVPIERQKLMAKAAWSGILKDGHDFAATNFQDGLQVTLMGTADVLAPSSTETVKFVEDMTVEEKAKIGALFPAGLRNLGNTCYMNATLQCLRYIGGVREALQRVPAGSLPSALGSLYTQMDQAGTALPPFQFFQTLVTSYPQFREMRNGTYMQQDADEFFSLVMQNLRDAVSNHPQLLGAVGIRLEEMLTCDEAPEEPPIRSEDISFKLVCNIQGGAGSTVVIDHMTDGLKLGLEGTIEKGSSLLGRDAVWTKRQKIASLPKVLCIQFMRFFWKATPESMDHTGVKCKILRAVNFPESFDIFEFCNDELQAALRTARIAASGISLPGESSSSAAAAAEGTTTDNGQMDVAPAQQPEQTHLFPTGFTGKYQLTGVVTHKGRSADSGHYMSYVRKADGGDGWWKFDDDKVSEATTPEILDLRGGGDRDMAYLCFFSMRY